VSAFDERFAAHLTLIPTGCWARPQRVGATGACQVHGVVRNYATPGRPTKAA